MEVNEAAAIIQQAVDPEANIIFGVAQDPSLDKEIKITLIATGFLSKEGTAVDNRDEERSKVLSGLKESEDQLDVPSFLRRPLFNHRRKAVTPTTRLDKAPIHTPLP